MKPHWHAATGLAGYGPDGSNGYATATRIGELADMMKDELERAADSAAELAGILGENEEYKEAWETHVLADELYAHAYNTSNDRAKAPLYRDNAKLWAEKVLGFLALYPLDIDIQGNTRLYVWECEFPDVCEHLKDDDN